MNSDNSNSAYHPGDRVILSIVIPAYNEEGNLRRLHSELMNVVPQLNISWEIIFSDDGSDDNTWNEIKSLGEENKNIKAIRFSRNFGHQYALLAGLIHATGQAIICMDADLQHPVEVIPQLVAEWQKGNKIVHTIRLDPKKITFFKKWTSKLFYKAFSLLSGIPIEEGMADFRLLDREVVHTILSFREDGLFLRGIVQWIGYPSSKIFFRCHDRHTGTSKYTLKKMIKLALTGITSFSIIPLRIAIAVGIFTSLIAFGELAYAVYAKVILGTTVPGWASAVSILAFLFGILFILLGVIGEYIGKILIEVRNRPRFIVREQVGITHVAKTDSDIFKYEYFSSSEN
ncbi:MAG: glycosyltransferase family 2 protein [Deltaproteobacteria bacterium]|nr:glycosyltransferase family 2 protein [Deltaproteobacteria bacterium]